MQSSSEGSLTIGRYAAVDVTYSLLIARVAKYDGLYRHQVSHPVPLAYGPFIRQPAAWRTGSIWA